MQLFHGKEPLDVSFRLCARGCVRFCQSGEQAIPIMVYGLALHNASNSRMDSVARLHVLRYRQDKGDSDSDVQSVRLYESFAEDHGLHI